MSQQSRQEPNTDKGWAWVILIAVFLNCFVCGIVYTAGIFNILFLELFGETRAKTSFCAALPTSLICFVAPFVSLLTNYIGPRMTVMLGSLMIFSGLTITAFMQSFGAVIVTYGVMLGLGFALIYTPSLVIVGFYFKKYRNIGRTFLFVVLNVFINILCIYTYKYIYIYRLSIYTCCFKRKNYLYRCFS